MPSSPSLLERVSESARLRWMRARKRLQQHLRLPRRPANQPAQIILVAGVQRSGTTMMMETLERSWQTDVYFRDAVAASDGYGSDAYMAMRAQAVRTPASHLIIKILRELHLAKSLLDDLAPARCVWCVRSVDDAVNSHLKLWSKMRAYLGRIVEDRDAAGWRGRGMSDATHEIVQRYYHPDMSSASAVALFWYFRHVLFFEQGLDRDARVRMLRYERLVTNPSKEFGDLFDFLGLTYTPEISRDVFATSIRRDPAPDISPAVRALCDDLMARFDAQGASVERGLAAR